MQHVGADGAEGEVESVVNLVESKVGVEATLGIGVGTGASIGGCTTWRNKALEKSSDGGNISF